ncbi:hypothetical protein [Belliella pelovolcani]|uniref:Peptidase family M48 n=1 Tax=Belliella pelovolcani TaxID=529505 RepID=A0A1N7LCY5_9BACT|nr:hypothetical protein [Belliella pelovolcani]SIS71657.1 hypothetical protein SAMN05421761_103233 [Belliella pelovolcani]
MRISETKYIQNSIPQELNEVIIKALDFYPDMKDVKIEFVLSKNIRKSVMQAQPKFITMLGPSKNRSYIIKISRFFKLKGKVKPIQELPDDVLVGWIGHELGHIMDYLNRSNWSLLLFGVGYLTSKSFIMAAERVADTYAVDHGLGDYILATKNFILHEAGMTEKYIQKINKLYLPPEEIIYMMENRPIQD